MIVSTTIEADGAIQVLLDSDGDQGQVYSSDVLDDMIHRAAAEAVVLYRELNGKATKPAARKKRKPTE